MVEPLDGMVPQIDSSAWVHAAAVVIGDVTVGADCSIWPNATLRGDEGRVVVGAGTNIQDGCTLHMTGGDPDAGREGTDTVVGERVTVGHNVILHGCTVEDDCLIGMGSLLMDNVVVGRGSYIGAGTLIPPGKIIPPGSMVYGNPFRIVRPVNARDTEWIAHAWTHYRDTMRRYKARDGG